MSNPLGNIDTITTVAQLGTDTLTAVVNIQSKDNGLIEKSIDVLIAQGLPAIFALIGALSTLLITKYLESKNSKKETAIKRADYIANITKNYQRTTNKLYGIDYDGSDVCWSDIRIQLMGKVDSINNYLNDFSIEHGCYLDDEINSKIAEIIDYCASASGIMKRAEYQALISTTGEDDQSVIGMAKYEAFEQSSEEADKKYGELIYKGKDEILSLLKEQFKRQSEGKI